MKKIIIPLVLIFWLIIFIFSYKFLKMEEDLIIKDSESEIIKEDKTVYLTENGERYHKKGCSALKNGFVEVAERDVKHAKIPPCQRCNP